MFNNISWQSYWIAIALFSAGYYLVIYVLYFRHDFVIRRSKASTSAAESSFLSQTTTGQDSQSGAAQQSFLFNHPEDFQRPEMNTMEHTVYTCMDEINAFLEEARRGKCVKEDVIVDLHRILRKYPTISTSEYKESLTNVIVGQCEYRCSVHLSADDVVRVWLGW